MEKKTPHQDEVFQTTDLATAAALLATDQLTFAGVDESGLGGRKVIFLAPRELALELYGQFRRGELMINARENGTWVRQLKNELFNNGGNNYGFQK